MRTKMRMIALPAMVLGLIVAASAPAAAVPVDYTADVDDGTLNIEGQNPIDLGGTGGDCAGTGTTEFNATSTDDPPGAEAGNVSADLDLKTEVTLDTGSGNQDFYIEVQGNTLVAGSYARANGTDPYNISSVILGFTAEIYPGDNGDSACEPEGAKYCDITVGLIFSGSLTTTTDILDLASGTTSTDLDSSTGTINAADCNGQAPEFLAGDDVSIADLDLNNFVVA